MQRVHGNRRWCDEHGKGATVRRRVATSLPLFFFASPPSHLSLPPSTLSPSLPLPPHLGIYLCQTKLPRSRVQGRAMVRMPYLSDLFHHIYVARGTRSFLSLSFAPPPSLSSHPVLLIYLGDLVQIQQPRQQRQQQQQQRQTQQTAAPGNMPTNRGAHTRGVSLLSLRATKPWWCL